MKTRLWALMSLGFVAGCSGDRDVLGKADGGGGGGAGGAALDAATDRGSGDTTDAGSEMNACGASMAPWPLIVELEHADCATRELTPCPQGVLTPQQALEGRLLRLAQDTCMLPSYHWVKVEFAAGCPRSLSIKTISQAPSSQLVNCLTTTLKTQRWACAVDLTCAVVEWDTLP